MVLEELIIYQAIKIKELEEEVELLKGSLEYWYKKYDESKLETKDIDN